LGEAEKAVPAFEQSHICLDLVGKYLHVLQDDDVGLKGVEHGGERGVGLKWWVIKGAFDAVHIPGGDANVSPGRWHSCFNRWLIHVDDLHRWLIQVDVHRWMIQVDVHFEAGVVEAGVVIMATLPLVPRQLTSLIYLDKLTLKTSSGTERGKTQPLGLGKEKMQSNKWRSKCR
jgi:hypothetical protein